MILGTKLHRAWRGVLVSSRVSDGITYSLRQCCLMLHHFCWWWLASGLQWQTNSRFSGIGMSAPVHEEEQACFTSLQGKVPLRMPYGLFPLCFFQNVWHRVLFCSRWTRSSAGENTPDSTGVDGGMPTHTGRKPAPVYTVYFWGSKNIHFQQSAVWYKFVYRVALPQSLLKCTQSYFVYKKRKWSEYVPRPCLQVLTIQQMGASLDIS